MKKENLKWLVLALVAVVTVGVVVFAGGGTLFQGKIAAKGPITRADFSKMLVIAADLEPVECNVFADVPIDAWYNNYVCALYNADVLKGYADGTFKAQNTINRAEAAKAIHLAFGLDQYSCPLPALFSDISKDSWYYDQVNELAAHEFFVKEVKIGSSFKPADNLTAAAANRWFSQSAKLQ